MSTPMNALFEEQEKEIARLRAENAILRSLNDGLMKQAEDAIVLLKRIEEMAK